MFCNNCGRQIEEGSKFCNACGQPVEEPTSAQVTSSPSQTPEPQPPPPQRKSSGFPRPLKWALIVEPYFVGPAGLTVKSTAEPFQLPAQLSVGHAATVKLPLPVLLVGIAVNAPETVLLLPPQRPFGGAWRPAPAWPGGDCLECSFAVWLPPLVCQAGGQPGVLHGRASLGFQDGRGHRKPARRSCFRRNPLHRCLGSRAENPGNRRAICLLEPLIPTSWRSLGSPEWGSWSQYQKDSGADRKSAISGHLGGWPMEGVFFSYGVWSLSFRGGT